MAEDSAELERRRMKEMNKRIEAKFGSEKSGIINKIIWAVVVLAAALGIYMFSQSNNGSETQKPAQPDSTAIKDSLARQNSLRAQHIRDSLAQEQQKNKGKKKGIKRQQSVKKSTSYDQNSGFDRSFAVMKRPPYTAPVMQRQVFKPAGRV